MEDNRTPQEFLSDLLQIVDTLDANKKEYSSCKEKREKTDAALDGLKKGIEKEKEQTLKARRSDLESGFDKQLKALEREIGQITQRRQKALEENKKARAKEQTADYIKASGDSRSALKNFVKLNKLPGILGTEFYYKLFCPGIGGYFLYVLIFILVMAALIILGHGAAVSNGVSAVAPYVIIGIAVIALAAVYIVLWANTRVKYRDEIRHCQDILKDININNRTAKKIEKNIMTSKDEASYDLHEFDAELDERNRKKAEINMQKSQAVYQFETETQQRLVREIDEKYEKRLAQLAADAEADAKALKDAGERVSTSESSLNQNYISMVGEKNLKHDRIKELIRLVEDGTASSVNDAVSKLG